MDVKELSLPGLLLFQPRVFKDERGFFFESFQNDRYREAGLRDFFVQDNHSRSSQGTLRGLHYQSSPGQGKLLRVARGRIFDVAVDIRPDSQTFGQWEGVYLDDVEHHQLFAPVGFAHGFFVTSDIADVNYKVTSPYIGDAECGMAWNDPDIGIEWPAGDPILSQRDQQNESFADYRKRITP